MWNDPASAIAQELSPGERLVWSGQPRGGIRLQAAAALLIPFSIVWCGFAVFWEAGALMAATQEGGPIAVAFSLFGPPFVIIGIYLVFGRFIVDARARARTFYGITNERIIIVSGLFGRRLKSLNLRTLSDLALTERSDGSGTITLGPTHSVQWCTAGSWPGGRRFAPPAFDMIDRAREVYEVIRKAQKSAV